MAVDINIDDLTTGSVDGTGTFDKMMATVAAQLDDQFKKNRMNASDYAKVYTQLMQSTMQSAIQFELGRELAAAQASLVIQQEANAVKEGELIDAQRLDVLAATDLKEAELLNIPKQGQLLDSQKLQVDAQTANVEAELLNIPKQGELVDAQKLQVDAQTANLEAELLNIPKQGQLLSQQRTNLLSEELLTAARMALTEAQELTEGATKLKIEAETALIGQQKTNATTQNTVLSSQKSKLDSEKSLLDQKKVTEEAQTKDSAGGSTVTGVIGKQKALYERQAQGFEWDAAVKRVKAANDVYAIAKSNDPDAVGDPSNMITVLTSKLSEL